mmetsp:Transcript_127716/g.361485  ORF Transcript_127716/g.361485 Transcript_127716/m.361485 type:complete len:367 (-) Transcript_127716:191-1291(-)
MVLSWCATACSLSPRLVLESFSCWDSATAIVPASAAEFCECASCADVRAKVLSRDACVSAVRWSASCFASSSPCSLFTAAPESAKSVCADSVSLTDLLTALPSAAASAWLPWRLRVELCSCRVRFRFEVRRSSMSDCASRSCPLNFLVVLSSTWTRASASCDRSVSAATSARRLLTAASELARLAFATCSSEYAFTATTSVSLWVALRAPNSLAVRWKFLAALSTFCCESPYASCDDSSLLLSLLFSPFDSPRDASEALSVRVSLSRESWRQHSSLLCSTSLWRALTSSPVHWLIISSWPLAFARIVSSSLFMIFTVRSVLKSCVCVSRRSDVAFFSFTCGSATIVRFTSPVSFSHWFPRKATFAS